MKNKLETITEQFLEECASTNDINVTLRSLDEITNIENKIIEVINKTNNENLISELENWQNHSKVYLNDIKRIEEKIKENSSNNEELSKTSDLKANKAMLNLIRTVAAYNLYMKKNKEQQTLVKEEDILAKKKTINDLYKQAFSTDNDFYKLENTDSLELKAYLPTDNNKSKLDEQTERFLEDCSYTNNIDASLASLDEITKKEQEIIEFINTTNNEDLKRKFSSMLYMWQKHSKTYIEDCLRIQRDLRKKGHTLYSLDKKPKEYLINLVRVVARYNLYIKRASEFNLSIDEKQIEEWKKSINILYRKTFDEEKEFYELKDNKELDLSFYVPDITAVKDGSKSPNKQDDDGLINIGDMLKETEEKKEPITFAKPEEAPKTIKYTPLVKGEPVIPQSKDYNRERILINSQIPSKPFVRKSREQKDIEVPAFIYDDYRSAEDYAFYVPIIINETTPKIRYTTSTVDITGKEPDYLLYSCDEPRYVISYNLLLKNNKVVSAYNKEQLQKALNAGGVVISVGTLDGFYKLSDITIVEEEKRKR